jgi:DNA-binding GntR family transcriptional regulator
MTSETEQSEQMLSEQVYRSIMRSVARGDLHRGSRLRIEELARSLNVSPTPVREALSRLEATGLVVHPPNRGFRIAEPLSGHQFDRLMDARELIEVGAAGLAVAAADTDFPGALRLALSEQRQAVGAFQRHERADEDAAWAVIDADLAFHHVILKHTDNSFAQLMAESLSGQSYRVRQSAEHGVSDAFEALTEHEAIVRAVESGDRAAVEAAMRLHMRLVRTRGHRDISGPAHDH